MNGRERVVKFERAIAEMVSLANDDSAFDRYITEQRALIADLDAPIRWRPIAEAPKDGTEVLAWYEKHYFAYYDPYFGGWVSRNGGRIYPTHFAELKGPQ